MTKLRQPRKGLVDQAAKMEVFLYMCKSNLYVKTCDIMKNIQLLRKKDTVLADIIKANSIKYHPNSPASTDPTNFKIGSSVMIR